MGIIECCLSALLHRLRNYTGWMDVLGVGLFLSIAGGNASVCRFPECVSATKFVG